VAILATGAALGLAAPPASAAGATEVFRLGDPRLTEVSGIAAGIASPDVLYVHNDSGDSARFFALDAHSGRVRGEYDVPGARNVDWEDIAVAPDARGVPSVWIGDIGDNDGTRAEVAVYRVDEPRVPAGAAAPITTGRPDVWRLSYPDGARDAESLAVTPGGAAYIVSKSLTGESRVYALPSSPDATRVQPVRRIGTVQLGVVRVGAARDLAGQLTATGGAFGGNGNQFVLRTYSDAYLWPVAHGDLAAALRARPTRVQLPAQPQGEGITISGTRLLVDSEQVGSAVYALPLPALPQPSATSAAPTIPPASGRAHPPPSVPARPASDSGTGFLWRAGGAVALVVAALVGIAVARGRSARQ
jgi:hypothetical protein